MNIKGYVIVKPIFKKTSLWPQNDFVDYDIEQDYKRAFANKRCPCIDIAVDGSGYMLIGKTERSGEVLWCIKKEDTLCFLPTIDPLKAFVEFLKEASNSGGKNEKREFPE